MATPWEVELMRDRPEGPRLSVLSGNVGSDGTPNETFFLVPLLRWRHHFFFWLLLFFFFLLLPPECDRIFTHCFGDDTQPPIPFPSSHPPIFHYSHTQMRKLSQNEHVMKTQKERFPNGTILESIKREREGRRERTNDHFVSLMGKKQE